MDDEHGERAGNAELEDDLPSDRPPLALSPQIRSFLSAPGRFATIATLNADGSPHQTVVWFLLRDDHIVLNSRAGRRWPANLLRDPRISLTVEAGLDAVTLSGVVEHDDDQPLAQADIAEMARRYDTPENAATRIARFRTEQRLRFLLRPRSMHIHGDPR
ncbi:MAG: pyridoxamine 5'-phosphate oxidase family protein [Chloroflexota bacterium]|nr:pyridoxamine 5'-phosphate oxidase family protein [Chloroflexota bacterium]